ncbi:MAG: LysR family transcriptional regulator [Clostridiales bacterium]|nr:LysR family transcriptional regulator [Clostridiales bacterium]
MLDFRITTFLTVCKTMNFTKAAEELHITQPTVSQHIHFLEEYYKTTLFTYQSRQLTLTSSGKLLHNRLTMMNNVEANLKKELQEDSISIRTLSLGVTMTIGEYAISDALASFLKVHPDTNVQLHYGNTAQLLQLLDDGKIRFALVEGYYPKDEYDHRKYITEDYIAVCAASHQFQCGNPTQLRDLLPERLLIRENGSGTRNILERNLSLKDMKISDFIHYTQVENMHTIIELLKKDCGISFLYKIAVKDELARHSLREIKLNDFSMKHDFDFIWAKGSIYAKEYETICDELCGMKNV